MKKLIEFDVFFIYKMIGFSSHSFICRLDFNLRILISFFALNFGKETAIKWWYPQQIVLENKLRRWIIIGAFRILLLFLISI